MLYINHFCEPNIGVQGQIIIVAMRDIDADEELNHDWATTDDLDYKMKCNCQSDDCRGIITGNDWEDPALQQIFEGWFSWFLQQEIEHK